jgi:hypothetical protein
MLCSMLVMIAVRLDAWDAYSRRTFCGMDFSNETTEIQGAVACAMPFRRRGLQVFDIQHMPVRAIHYSAPTLSKGAIKGM